MALVDSNTYIEPTAGTALNSARSQINNSLRSILTNFRSSVAPSSVNLRASGANIGEQDGMFFRSTITNALYISDSTQAKTSPVGGNFTRIGLGNRIEDGIISLTANVATYEIGELVATVSASPGIASNARLYLNIANNSTMADFIDVGIPPTNGSVVNTMIAIGGVTSDRVNFRNSITNGTSGSNAQLKVSTAVGSNTGIALGTSNTSSNVTLVKMDGSHGQGITAGINIIDQTGKQYAPLAANIISQATIQGATTTIAPLVPAGTIVAWAGATAPAGYVLADGTAVSRTTYAALYAICGTTFGVGDGSTTFNLPNSTGRTVIGVNGSFVRGASSAAVGAGAILTTGSSTQTITPTTVSVAASAKDSSLTTVVSGISTAAHTHTFAMAGLGCYYIIKT
jgi:microcystin-dependent protein